MLPRRWPAPPYPVGVASAAGGRGSRIAAAIKTPACSCARDDRHRQDGGLPGARRCCTRARVIFQTAPKGPCQDQLVTRSAHGCAPRWAAGEASAHGARNTSATTNWSATEEGRLPEPATALPTCRKILRFAKQTKSGDRRNFQACRGFAGLGGPFPRRQLHWAATAPNHQRAFVWRRGARRWRPR